MKTLKGWIGVDLDGTLAHYDGWRGPEHIGEPIGAMLWRVKKWISDGKNVKLFTARANDKESLPYVEAWLKKHGLEGMPITAHKDYSMITLWDDRCVQVEPNTGRRMDGEE